MRSAPRLRTAPWNWRPGLTSGSLGLMLTLMLLSGCRSTPQAAKSAYRVLIPVLTVAPRVIACEIAGHVERCVVLLQRDYTDLVIELKSACVAGGQSETECWAALPEPRTP